MSDQEAKIKNGAGGDGRPKRAYRSPSVRRLGSVAELTLNASTVQNQDTITNIPNTKNTG